MSIKLQPGHSSWRAMHRRCADPNQINYSKYGGRGIRVCARWASFEAFVADIGPRPSAEHSIDRKDNDGHYSCGKCEECVVNGWAANCRWATPTEQARNRGDNVRFEFGGELLTLAEWSERTGIRSDALAARIRSGLPPEQVFAKKFWKKAATRPESIRLEAEPVSSDVANKARGDRVGTSKLNQGAVLEMRRIYAAGDTTQRALATRFGVSKTAVRDVLLRKVWRHV